MSTLESQNLTPGRPALSKGEIEDIKSSLDVLVVGMNPSLSQRTYKQLYDRLKKRDGAKGLLDVLGQLSEKAKRDFVESLSNESFGINGLKKHFPLQMQMKMRSVSCNTIL